MSRTVRHVVVVGGGSAGWLTAGVIAATHGPESGVRVTVVESPDVKTIGVGEGTWPSMRDTLRRIGLSETDLLRDCDAAFKQGSRFRGWITGAENDSYYHPFTAPAGFGAFDLVPTWRAEHAEEAYADLASPQALLCELGRAPKQLGTPEFAAVANYAYHLDAGKFGELLRNHCTERLGVRHCADHVTDVKQHESGDIEAVVLREAGSLAGDLFVDCTGFRALLIGDACGVPFESLEDFMFCDRALALQVPWAESDTPIPPYTSATAKDFGWIWDIGLPTRRGVGHVYASRYGGEEAAHAALIGYLEATGAPAEVRDLVPRSIEIRPGHRERFWSGNCVAVGLSAGFIEPLEASALALIEQAAAMIADNLPATRSAMDLVSARFNNRFRYRWARIVEFLKLHYALTQREDTAFWRDNRDPARLPRRLRDNLELWRDRAPSRYDFHELEEIFPAASYQYILYGMGRWPDLSGRVPDARARGALEETKQLGRKLAAALPDHRTLLAQIRERGLTTV
jgi:flavin-dependent dehydrogenase